MIYIQLGIYSVNFWWRSLSKLICYEMILFSMYLFWSGVIVFLTNIQGNTQRVVGTAFRRIEYWKIEVDETWFGSADWSVKYFCINNDFFESFPERLCINAYFRNFMVTYLHAEGVRFSVYFYDFQSFLAYGFYQWST